MKKFVMFSMVVFTGICFALSDSPDTVGLWHCDSMFESGGKFYTPDDDSVMIGRNYDLTLGNGTTLTATPGFDGTGYALDFDGVNDYGARAWGLHDNIKIELAFKADTLAAANKYFVEIASIYRLYMSASNLIYMTVWDSTGAATTKNLTVAVVAGQWYRLEASYESDGLFSLFLYDASNNLLDGLQGIYGNGIMAKTGTPNFVLGSYRGTQYYFDGQIDEVKVSNYVYPAWAMPYEDVAGTVLALWHFDALADPNTSGVTYKLMPDDDSDNDGRNADLMLYSGLTTLINNGATGGPTLVDPDVEGIGYPAGNEEFGKCAYFDDPVLVEGDSFRVSNSKVKVDPTNIRVDCWIRPADEIFETPTTVNISYFVVERWGQFYISFVQTPTDYLISAMSFGSDAVNKAISASYTTLGLDESDWVHVSYRFYQGVAELYINGGLAATTTLATTSLMATPAKPDFYVGKRYNNYALYFWGYMDEIKVSQAVYSVGCGAWGYLPGDINEDCTVGIPDLDLLADQWLMTTEPSDPQAVEGSFTQYQTYNIPMAVTTPTIDGTLSAGEWDDAKEIYLAMPELTTAPNVGGQKYEMPTHEDFSSYYYMKWDATYLYVGIKVIDDALVFDAGYPDDHVTLAFNPLKAGTVQADVAFYQMFRDYFGASQIVMGAGFNTAFDAINAVKANAVQANGWSFEVAYKWSDFNGYSPTVGDQHGAAIMICDNDVADGLRDTFLFDSGSGDTTVLGLPSLYRVATLTSGIACGDTGYLADDINQDCDVNLFDYADMADNWLACTTPGDGNCVDAR